MGRSSVFSLEQIYRKQITQTWSNIFDPFRYVSSVGSQGPAFGYFAGGKDSGPLRSTVDRVDYSNDNTTATAKGALPAVRYYMAPAGNRSYGWFTGGNSAGYPTNSLSTVYRLDYGSDSTSPTPKGNLSIIRAMHAGTGNENYGYFAAGDATTHSSNPVYSTIDRIDYANDTATSTPKGLLNEAKTMIGAAGNQSYGYFGGGSYTLSSIDRIDYGNDTATATPKGNLGVGVRLVGGTSNPSYAYFGGGFGPSNHTTHIQRLDFASDTGAPLRGTLGTAGSYQNSATGNASFGYWGGADGSSGNYGSIIQRLDYSNDTGVAGTRGNLSTSASFGTAGVSARDYALPTMPTPATRGETYPNPAGGPAFAYFGASTTYQPSGPNTDIDRIDYSNDTATALVKGLMNNARNSSAGTSNITHGYIAGGYSPSLSSRTSFVDRIDYSNDTATAVVKGVISNGRNSLLGSGNSSYGWIGGGSGEPGGVAGGTRVDRIDYSNDTATASPRGNLSQFRANGGAVSTQSYGYYGAGNSVDPPSYPTRTSVDRIDFSNDTSTALLRGVLTVARYRIKASGNTTHGYWAGGDADPYSPSIYSIVDRLDFSNDTANQVAKGPLASPISNMGATTSGSFGYYAGTTTPAGRSAVQRIDYSNDTAIASPKGSLSRDRISSTGVSAAENASPTPTTKTVDKGADGYTNTTTTLGPAYGYWGGGEPSAQSTVDRIDYSNDSTNMVSKGPLTNRGYYFVGISSPAYGYTCGNLYPGYRSYVQRADYANDTATAVVKGPLTRSDGSASGLNSRSYGYFAGGQNPGNNSYVDRIDFSNDSATASPKGNLDTGRGKCAGTSNQNYGWATGGIEPGTSKVSRIDFSNDTSTSLPKGTMNVARMGHSGSGNANYGYQAGGNNNFNSSVDRIDYSNDTSTASPKGPLSLARRYVDGVSSPSYGWHAGGEYDPAGTDTSTCDRIDFSSDTTTAAVKGSLTSARAWFMGNHSSQSNDGGTSTSSYIPRIRWVDSQLEVFVGGNHGYFGAGSYNARSIVDRVDFDNDTATATPKGNMSSSRYKCTGMGNKSFGYFGGGRTTSPYTDVTTVDRLDYANDSTNMVAKGPLANSHSTNDAGVGNDNFGYWCGSVGKSWVDRIEYANDTATASTKGALNYNRSLAYGVSSPSHGYVGGGETPAHRSNIDRINFANDTATASLKGDMTQAKYAGGATGNASYGYFGGGVVMPNPTPISNIDRTDFSNDTVTALSKGPLARVNWLLSATGNTSYGYWGGGYGDSSYPNGLSIVDRLDYSNDTQAASPKGNTSVLFRNTSAFSPRENALPTTGIVAAVQPPFAIPTTLPGPDYQFSSFTFTAASVIGPDGPTQSDFNSAYSGQPFMASHFSSSNGIQLWTPPLTGLYQIELRGATGGRNGTHTSGTNQCYPGQGALIICNVTLSKTTQYSMVVGQKPSDSTGQNGSAGGGGSWIYTGSIGGGGLIACAGGGGGWGHGNSTSNGGNGLGGSSSNDSRRVAIHTIINGRTGNGTGATNGVGEGGGISTTGNFGGGAGGCGWNSDGTDRTASMASDGGHSAGTGASDAWVGGAGGAATLNGGFGGGGGSNGNGRGGGGGGGYTGGPAGNDWDGSRWGNGGGGGSYYTGVLVSSSDGLDGGDSGTGGNIDSSNGYIKITLLG